MPGSQLVENIFNMLRSCTQTNKDTHTKVIVNKMSLLPVDFDKGGI